MLTKFSYIVNLIANLNYFKMKNNLLYTIAKYLLALIFVVFGANKLIGFMEMPPLADPTAQNFLEAVFTSYLGKLIGIVEIVGGILLVIPKTSFLGLVILAPVVFNIMFFHVFHDFPGNPAWILTFILALITAFSHKDRIQQLIE